MLAREPSRTALGVAAMRAAHQHCGGLKIFDDPFAISILGPQADVIMTAMEAAMRDNPERRMMGLFIAARSRFAEDMLARSVHENGVGQAVILGAGLDTFGLRNPCPALRVFEVDHPATQMWKRERLAHAAFTIPENLTFAAIDFERDQLRAGLCAAGFDPSRPAFFIWLGVTPYLTHAAFTETIDFISSTPEGRVVFDYSEPLKNYHEDRRAHVEALAQQTAAMGEPWLSLFDPGELAALLQARGFSEIVDMSHADIMTRYFSDTDIPIQSGAGAHILYAQHLD